MKQGITRLYVLLIFAFAGITAHSQDLSDQRTITGNVVDNAGEAIQGVNVIVKGTNNGVVTDEEGHYSIRAFGTDVLTFSFIGMKTVERQVGTESNIDVTMVEDSEQLDDVVVVGYGEQKREHLTGAVETVDIEEINQLPVGDLGTALSGRILGVGVSGGSTRPGTAAQLTIRNPITLSKDGGDLQPLYVIDGVLQLDAQGRNDNSYFNSLDASEVESISILKDAAAAVYGSRASNGVVVVTTKRGKEGAPRFSYSGSYGISDEQQRTEVLNAYEYAQYYNILNGPNGRDRDPSEENSFFSQDELEYFRNNSYDWLEDAWSSSTTQRHTLNVSGGSDLATYFGGVSYYTQDGNLGPIDYDRFTFRAGTDVNVANGLNVGLQLSGNFTNEDRVFSKIGGENPENDYRNLLLAPPYLPPYVNGFPVRLPSAGSREAYHYYEIQRLGNTTHDRSNDMRINLDAEYAVPFVEGLKLSARYGRSMGHSRNNRLGTFYNLYEIVDRGGDNHHIYEQGTVGDPRRFENGNEIRKSNITSLLEQFNGTISYANDFGKHSVSGLFSMERSESEAFQEDAAIDDPLQDSNGTFRTAFGAPNVRDFTNEAGSLSYIGRLNYQYDDRYLFEFLYRTDASTKFAPENYWGDFYSLSAGWILSREDFFTADWVDFFKIRYSVGLLGKDDTKPWLWRQRYTYQYGNGIVLGGGGPVTVGVKAEASPNRAATWSDDFKNNLGFDARFLDNRLTSTIELFYNEGTNILLERIGNVPFTVGGTLAAENFAEVNFYGYEIGVGWNDRIGDDFSYGIDARFSWNDNKMKVGNFNDEDILKPWFAKPNESTDFGVYGYDYLGMFEDQDEIDAYVEEYNIQEVFGTSVDDLEPGTLYYRDVRGEYLGDGEFAEPDGIIDENDQIKLADKEQNHYGFGTTLKFRWKDLSFNAVVAGSFGGWSEYAAKDALNSNIARNFSNLPKDWNDIYDPQLNPDGTMPNPAFTNINFRRSQFWEQSAFSMAVRNVTLGYRLPRTVSESLNIENANLNFTALNPLNLYNPNDHFNNFGNWQNYPVLRTFSLGLNVTF
ncbi:SusC/RagA family TonB-linked outer membrane protein [Gramella jeungdoensis]|uniref:SusC/RagA family TonB-linked outer membrane protein n=1 Tax=Gramella jeungdoensis TaxID=708091 RepID=A0ABT0Z104_9FLAO|nr:SusC/RagA family TonB-linked outer membrane protein [Gramella jeungdoensis]MCM8568484.1 SusC/RagA family TonB-linked outer membrane protein [Gramella jeungdoensis]